MSKKRNRLSDLPVIPLEWVPVRRGPLYCSPACGCRCLHVDYIRASKGAHKLLKQLKGEGWQTAVWESAGWHFKAESEPLTVFGDHLGEHGAIRYACTMLGQPDNFVSDDPNEAVAHILDHCLAGADRALGDLFKACSVAHQRHEFFRVFSQHSAVKFLNDPEDCTEDENEAIAQIRLPIHLSYRDDAGFMMRLEAAVLGDKRQSEQFRQETASAVRTLAEQLLLKDALQRKPAKT